jgi:chloramphenicol O-acetyltransferase type B
MILSGVRIGDGAVIGAGAVVTRDVPPYGIVVGNPAKLVRHRFPMHDVDTLLALQWWNWDDQKIRSGMQLLLSGNVSGLKKFSDGYSRE